MSLANRIAKKVLGGFKEKVKVESNWKSNKFCADHGNAL